MPLRQEAEVICYSKTRTLWLAYHQLIVSNGLIWIMKVDLSILIAFNSKAWGRTYGLLWKTCQRWNNKSLLVFVMLLAMPCVMEVAHVCLQTPQLDRRKLRWLATRRIWCSRFEINSINGWNVKFGSCKNGFLNKQQMHTVSERTKIYAWDCPACNYVYVRDFLLLSVVFVDLRVRLC